MQLRVRVRIDPQLDRLEALAKLDQSEALGLALRRAPPAGMIEPVRTRGRVPAERGDSNVASSLRRRQLSANEPKPEGNHAMSASSGLLSELPAPLSTRSSESDVSWRSLATTPSYGFISAGFQRHRRSLVSLRAAPPAVDRVVPAEIFLVRDNRLAEFGQRQSASLVRSSAIPQVFSSRACAARRRDRPRPGADHAQAHRAGSRFSNSLKTRRLAQAARR